MCVDCACAVDPICTAAYTLLAVRDFLASKPVKLEGATCSPFVHPPYAVNAVSHVCLMRRRPVGPSMAPVYVYVPDPVHVLKQYQGSLTLQLTHMYSIYPLR